MQTITVNLNLNRGSCRILKPLYLGETVDINFDTEGSYSLILTEPFADSPKDGIAVWAQSSEGKLALTRKALHNAFKKANATQPNMTISAKVFVQDESGATVADGEVVIEYSPAAYIMDMADYPTAAETLAQAMNAKDAAERAKDAAERVAQATVSVKDAAERAKSAAESAAQAAESAKSAAEREATNAGTEAGRAAKEAADAKDAAIEAKNALASGSEAIKAAVAEEKRRAETKEREIEGNVAKISEGLNSTTEALNAVKDTANKASEALKTKADLVDGKIPASQIPGSVDDIEEVESFSEFPAKGEANKIYLALDSNKAYRWGGSTYVEISPSIALGDTYTTAFPGNRGAAVEAAVTAEVARAKGAEAVLDGRVTELEENGGGGSSVEVVAPSPDGEGKAADAKAVYEELEKKRDLGNRDYVVKVDPIKETQDSRFVISDASGTARLTLNRAGETWVGDPSNIYIQFGDNAAPPIGTDTTYLFYIRVKQETRQCLVYKPGYLSYSAEVTLDSNYYAEVTVEGVSIKIKGVTEVTDSFALKREIPDLSEYAKKSDIPAAPDLSAYAKTAEVMPRYPFVNAGFKWEEEFTEATITIAPYTNARKNMGNYPNATYTIEVADGDGVYCRDCVLRLTVPSGISAPKLLWGTNFHPRTDKDTDFACEVGVRNVYWITEYADGEFVVAGWQETVGGNAE